MKRRILVIAAVLVVVLAGGGFRYFTHSQTSEPVTVATAPLPEIPVVAATVASKNVPIYLRGVGTVIAYNTDVVRSQIQGQLTQITFIEGQTRQGGRPARADRSAPLPGPDRRTDRQSRARQRAACQCAGQSLPL